MFRPILLWRSNLKFAVGAIAYQHMQDIRTGCFGGVFVPEGLCGFTKAWDVFQSALVSSVSLQDECGDCWKHWSPTSQIVVLFAACTKNKEAASQTTFNNLKFGFLGKGVGDFRLLHCRGRSFNPKLPQTAVSSFYQEFMVPQMKSTVALGWDGSSLRVLKVLWIWPVREILPYVVCCAEHVCLLLPVLWPVFCVGWWG